MNTEQSFRDKWHRNRDLFFAETLREGSDTFNWILTRNGFTNANEFAAFLAGKRRILDAGCGNGRVTTLLRTYSDEESTELVGIDLVAADVARQNLSQFSNVSFHKKDLLQDLSDLGSFDFIYCQEVLHHTTDPRGAFLNLTKLLEPGGEIAIYVYKKKAPIREYADDFVRDQIADMSYEDAIRVSGELAAFGRALVDLNVRVHIPAVTVLEIPEGEYDVQRLLYHFFLKCYWNPDVGLNENAVVNYDWYHPQNCSRHTLDEVLEWFAGAELAVTHSLVDFYGVTVRGRAG
jgi:SAM-dependent methyltransferase